MKARRVELVFAFIPLFLLPHYLASHDFGNAARFDRASRASLGWTDEGVCPYASLRGARRFAARGRQAYSQIVIYTSLRAGSAGFLCT